eukprot:TRINITY_DN2495_c0_g2_i2.p1 TRINITY_DN2495_c0_g2~~TRINITY_DN2495_c0_g2_i2.p1  ORF type:complete len:656 (+),score=170.73 TRINITY_DN2495_c0_g2_i2:76-1968(+)
MPAGRQRDSDEDGAPPGGWGARPRALWRPDSELPLAPLPGVYHSSPSAITANAAVVPPPQSSAAFVPSYGPADGALTLSVSPTWGNALTVPGGTGGAQRDTEARRLAWRAVQAGEEAESRAQAAAAGERAARDELARTRQALQRSEAAVRQSQQREQVLQQECEELRRALQRPRGAAEAVLKSTMRGIAAVCFQKLQLHAAHCRVRRDWERQGREALAAARAEAAALRTRVDGLEAAAAAAEESLADAKAQAEDADELRMFLEQAREENRLAVASSDAAGRQLTALRADVLRLEEEVHSALRAQRRAERERAEGREICGELERKLADLRVELSAERDALGELREQLRAAQQAERAAREDAEAARAALSGAKGDNEELAELLQAAAAAVRAPDPPPSPPPQPAPSRALTVTVVEPPPPVPCTSRGTSPMRTSPRLSTEERWRQVAAASAAAAEPPPRSVALPAPGAAQLKLLAELVQAGGSWLRRVWPPSQDSRGGRVSVNPGLAGACPAARRFFRGTGLTGCAEGPLSGSWELREVRGGCPRERADAAALVCHWGHGHPASFGKEGVEVANSAGPAPGAADWARAAPPLVLSYAAPGSPRRHPDAGAAQTVPLLVAWYGDHVSQQHFLLS